MISSNAIKVIELTTFDAGDLIATFLPINTTGLPDACYKIRIINRSKGDVIVSYDGVTDNDYVQHDTVLNVTVPTQKKDALAFRKKMKVYLRGAIGIGYIHLIGYYQPRG